jgi:RNA polymerase sigma-70 factor (ECF subfamily)
MPVSHFSADADLVHRIRTQDPGAWEALIALYERRLLAFAEQRLGDQVGAEDVVQETFLGFLRALPNYDDDTPLETFLFAIASHKLKDVLRQRGRRPFLSMWDRGGETTSLEPAGKARRASTIARSAERRAAAEAVLTQTLRDLVQSWYSRGEFERLACAELLFVLGWPNKDVAAKLGISEQAVANHKQFIVQKLKAAAGKSPDAAWQELGFQ